VGKKLSFSEVTKKQDIPVQQTSTTELFANFEKKAFDFLISTVDKLRQELVNSTESMIKVLLKTLKEENLKISDTSPIRNKKKKINTQKEVPDTGNMDFDSCLATNLSDNFSNSVRNERSFLLPGRLQ